MQKLPSMNNVVLKQGIVNSKDAEGFPVFEDLPV